MIFKVENEIKHEYLSNKPTATADSDSFVLRSIDEYEELIGKSVYNFSVSELDELFSTFKNSSKKTVDKNKSILATYIDFCISKNLVSHQENRAIFIDVKKHISKQALLNRYISREKLVEYQGKLYNEQDQLLLLLPFIGVLGRTIEEGTKEEMLNLTIDDVIVDENKLILRQNNGESRELYVDESVIKLIQKTYNRLFYVENNGGKTQNKRIKDSAPRQTLINKTGTYEKYILRTPGKNKFDRFSLSLFNSRMGRIQKIVGNKYLTYSNLYFSGMIQMAMDIYKEKGEVTDKDFDKICRKFNYGVPESFNKSNEFTDKKVTSYWCEIKSLFNQYKELLL